MKRIKKALEISKFTSADEALEKLLKVCCELGMHTKLIRYFKGAKDIDVEIDILNIIEKYEMRDFYKSLIDYLIMQFEIENDDLAFHTIELYKNHTFLKEIASEDYSNKEIIEKLKHMKRYV